MLHGLHGIITYFPYMRHWIVNGNPITNFWCDQKEVAKETMHIVRCALHNAHCAVCATQCTLHTAHCTHYEIIWFEFNIHLLFWFPRNSRKDFPWNWEDAENSIGRATFERHTIHRIDCYFDVLRLIKYHFVYLGLLRTPQICILTKSSNFGLKIMPTPWHISTYVRYHIWSSNFHRNLTSFCQNFVWNAAILCVHSSLAILFASSSTPFA